MAVVAACAKPYISSARLSAFPAPAIDARLDARVPFDSRELSARPVNSAMTNPVPAANSSMFGELNPAWSRSPSAARCTLTACLSSASWLAADRI